MESIVGSEDNRPVCKRCNLVLKDNLALESHTITCNRPQKGGSFNHMFAFGTAVIGNPTPAIIEENGDKFEPLSQPIPPLPQAEDYNTTTAFHSHAHFCVCGRSFKKARGLARHKPYCKGITVPPAEAIQVPDVGVPSRNEDESGTENVNLVQQPESQSKSKSWGKHSPENVVKSLNVAYEEVVFWKKNMFKLPSGASGKSFLREMTRLIENWTGMSDEMSAIALKALMVMPALLLQKPSRKSSAKQHKEYLTRRLDLWSEGNFEELLKEGRYIQHKMQQKFAKDEENAAKMFTRFMLLGKVNAALRLLDKQEALGVAKLDGNTIKKLRELHPEAVPAKAETLQEGEIPYFDPVIFTNIDEDAIAKAAIRTRGAAGPSGVDADAWRRFLISKNYGTTGKELRTAIAKMAQKLCTTEIALQENNKTSLEAYIACRLIPLEKKPSGVRPIGIGEVLRRIIGKAVMSEINQELKESAGSLQLCAGQKSGCEAAAHAMREIYQEAETDAVLLIDASNAFNCLNREAMLHNIRYVCPELATYVINCYKVPSRLFVAGGIEISSSEGTTQGDPSAMPSYAVGILPFLSLIKPVNQPELMKQVAYADDLAGGSKLEILREWWQRTTQYGPAFGYYPKPEKSWLVVKEDQLARAEEIFQGTNINITTDGQKYLGGFLGTEEAVEKYVKDLVEDWISQLDVLVEIARSEPQAAYTAFTSGFRHKMTYYIRTIPNISEILKPFDEKVTKDFIPAITEGHQCTPMERSLLSLPVRMGGLGIPIFSDISNIEFNNSVLVTKQLTNNINRQIHEYIIDKEQEKKIEQTIKKERRERQEKLSEEIRGQLSKEELRANDIAQLKGASSWLNALPLEAENYSLNKREFFDALQLRYRWTIKRLPLNCACKQKFSPDHAMQCINGGFIHKRHDRIKDAYAKLIDEVAYDVRVEPPLEPLTGETLTGKAANRAEGARLDIAARGFWQDGAMAFFDVRVFNPFAKTHMKSELDKAFETAENEKKDEYNERVIKIEHGSFTPLVLSAYGGYSRETERFMSRLITKIAEKRDVPISVIANYVRTKLSFILVRSQVMCIRGCRKLWGHNMDILEAEVVQCVGKIRED